MGMSLLSEFPCELFLHVTSFLDVEDILSLRKTCTALYQATQDSSLWIDFLHRQQSLLPLPKGARSGDSIGFYSAVHLESIVVDAHRANKRWLAPREDTPLSLQKIGDSIIYIDIFLDRWFVAVYCECLIGIWDLDGEDPGKVCASMELRGGLCISSLAALDIDEDAIIIVITGSYRVSILRVELEAGPLRFEEMATVNIGPVDIIRAISSELRLASFSRNNVIDVLNWETMKWLTIPTQSEDMDELVYQWNGIVALKFCEENILCIKARSIELYPLPSFSYYHDLPFRGYTSSHHPSRPSLAAPQPAKQPLPDTTFRGVSISSAQLTPLKSQNSSQITTTLIAYDVFKGLFHFLITIGLPEQPLSPTSPNTASSESLPPPTTFSVELLAVHNMMRQVSDQSSDVATNNPALDGLLLQHGWHPAVTRGFISTCYLGPEGRRGVWIERTRSSTQRAVVSFSVDWTDTKPIPVRTAFPPFEDIVNDNGNGDQIEEYRVVNEVEGGSGEDTSKPPVPWMGARHIDGRPVYVISSCDLGDDLTHCTFSEISGRIIVGTRDGSLRLL